ncbi:MAG TPA: response regulator transcription factor [Chitinophagaceae bacterium]|nr:response regulator transcription factor [Chitinophagaceae bacterium]
MPEIKIIIIEDQEEIRKGYEFLINNSNDFSCIGYANAEDAIDNVFFDKPEIILMDVNLPGISGIEATKLLKEKFPKVHIIIFTVYENNENVFQALEAGASGYILKQTKPAQLIEAIKEVYNGGAPMSSRIAKMVVASFQKKNIVDNEEELTERENEILKLLSAGYRNKEVSEKLFISLSTVKSHVYNIYQKLHVTTRVEALNKIRRHIR